MKKQEGITLIALVITIIVLLILAGVTIVTLAGDNGLLTKTADSKNENIIGTEKDKIGLGYNEYRIKKYTDANPTLTVEGATSVEGNETTGWTIKFTEHEYKLSANGMKIDGPITSSDGGQDPQPGGNITDAENDVIQLAASIALNHSDLFGGQEKAEGFRNEWVDVMTQLDIGYDECNNIKESLNAMEQMITGQNINSAEQFDSIMPQLLSMLNSTYRQYGFYLIRDNSTRIWTSHYM